MATEQAARGSYGLFVLVLSNSRSTERCTPLRDPSPSGDEQATLPLLEALGWNSFFGESFAPFRERGFIPGRVALGHRSGYRLYTAADEIDADLAGRFRHRVAGSDAWPAVGDWVAIATRSAERRATIHAVLPRLTQFSRKAAGGAIEEQVVAANVDTVLLIGGLDHDFNLRRLERYLVVAWESGAAPVIVLSKADLCADVDDRVAKVRTIASGAPTHVISVLRNEGLTALAPYFTRGRTVAVLGSSGVGKSTLINHLAGRAILRTGDVRIGEGRGRHTTTHRELIRLPGGGLVIDTPGLRELQLWDAGHGHHRAFDEVEAQAERCRFQDCAHHAEPGCAVQQAVADGVISAARFEHYAKLQKELRHLEARLDKRAQRAQKEQDKAIHRLMRKHQPRT